MNQSESMIESMSMYSAYMRLMVQMDPSHLIESHLN